MKSKNLLTIVNQSQIRSKSSAHATKGTIILKLTPRFLILFLLEHSKSKKKNMVAASFDNKSDKKPYSYINIHSKSVDRSQSRSQHHNEGMII